MTEQTRTYRVPDPMDLTTAHMNIIRKQTGVDVMEPPTQAAGAAALLWWAAQDEFTWAQIIDMPMNRLNELIEDPEPLPDPATLPPVVPDPSGIEPVPDPTACDRCGHRASVHRLSEQWCTADQCNCGAYVAPSNPFEGEADPTRGSGDPEP